MGIYGESEEKKTMPQSSKLSRAISIVRSYGSRHIAHCDRLKAAKGSARGLYVDGRIYLGCCCTWSGTIRLPLSRTTRSSPEAALAVL